MGDLSQSQVIFRERAFLLAVLQMQMCVHVHSVKENPVEKVAVKLSVVNNCLHCKETRKQEDRLIKKRV